MKILFVTSECYPFLKTGGLADVSHALPKALKKEGLEVKVIMPNYGTIDEKFRNEMTNVASLSVNVGWRDQYLGIKHLNYEDIDYYFIDNMYYFFREKPYGYHDDGERFAYFSQAVIKSLEKINFIPDIIHCNDWHSSTIPVLLKEKYENRKFYDIKTVLTIHNLKFQGVFPAHILGEVFGLSNDLLNEEGFEFNGNANFLKGGINYADKVTTVSPTYLKEIQTEYYGEGLDGLLYKFNYKSEGIINGIDYELNNPKTDKRIHKIFHANYLKGKEDNKTYLQKKLGLKVDKNIPMYSIITRLTDQKGINILSEILDKFLNKDVQLVVLGTGDIWYEDMFRHFEKKYKGKVSSNILYDDKLAQEIYAGSDFFLMPSAFEPCGLSQMISLRYGTIPIVRETGGLKDTVEPYNKYTSEGLGITFANYDSWELLGAIDKSLELYENESEFKKIRVRAMKVDYSWKKSAKKYIKLYKSIL